MHEALLQLQTLTLLLPLIGFSVLAFFSKYPPVFMITSGIALMTGLKWYDVFTNDTGLAVSLVIIAYAFICTFFSFRYIFWKEERISEE